MNINELRNTEGEGLTALIDADLITYSASCAAETVDEGHERRSFDYVIENINDQIKNIVDAVIGDGYELFLTGKGNFRFDVATVKPYKGNRKDEDKPFYLEAARKFLEGAHNAFLCEGYEADDGIAMRAKQFKDPQGYVICSIDKDLNMIQGKHYSWETHNSPEKEVFLVDEIGDLDFVQSTAILKNGEQSKAIKKVSGTGLKWFYCQLITGDSTDNIPGIEGKGAGLAKEILPSCNTEWELFEAVKGAYQAKYNEKAEERMLEQGRLLWMHNEVDEQGEVILWEFPNVREAL